MIKVLAFISCLVLIPVYLYGVRDELVPWLKSIRLIESCRDALVWIDQGGNVLAGGHHHSTISARVGFYSKQTNEAKSSRRHHWLLMEGLIDWAFEPVDGKRHCCQAMMADPDKDFHHGGTFRLFVLGVLVSLFAPIIGVAIRAYEWLASCDKDYVAVGMAALAYLLIYLIFS